MATTNELVEEVLAHQFNPRYSGQVIKWLDQAQKKIIRQTDVRTHQEEIELTVAVTESSISLPTDFARTISLRIVADNLQPKMKKVDLNTFDNIRDSSDTGQPAYYSVSESSIYLTPTADGDYTFYLRYWKMPTTITSNVDPFIPTDYHELLVEFALSKAYAAEHDQNYSKFHRDNFKTGLMEMRGETQFDTNDGPVLTPSMWANSDF